MRSLRSRLWLLWLLALVASIGVGLLLAALSRSSTGAELARAQAVAARSCDLIGNRYAFYVSGWPGGPLDASVEAGLRAVVFAALAPEGGVEGGIWSVNDGSIARAFPTDGGLEPAVGGPATAARAVREVNREAEAADADVSRRFAGIRGGALVAAACPLPGPLAGLTAWATIRVRPAGTVDQLRLGVGLLFALLVAIAGSVAWLTLVWGRHVRAIESALAAHDIEALPTLTLTGERELDRIVIALNEAGARLAAARARTAEFAARSAATERLAALGRVSAGLAHEIRNPMAAMRLRLENALAGDPGRLQPAVRSSLEQVARIDGLITGLLAMSQRNAPDRRSMPIDELLRARVAEHRPMATAAGVAIEVDAVRHVIPIDADMIGRAVDNLLLNAVRHTPGGGTIRVLTERRDRELRITFVDNGPGVERALRSHLFEPFATGRADGTGLGLAIAREMVEAHGGRLSLVEDPSAGGAAFAIVLPVEAG